MLICLDYNRKDWLFNVLLNLINAYEQCGHAEHYIIDNIQLTVVQISFIYFRSVHVLT